MTDLIAKGGRGHKAPYLTTHARIPEGIKPVVEKLASEYRQKFVGDIDPDTNGATKLLERVETAIAYSGRSAIASSEVSPRTEIDYQAARDRILKKVRSDKLKAVTKALDEFIAELGQCLSVCL